MILGLFRAVEARSKVVFRVYNMGRLSVPSYPYFGNLLPLCNTSPFLLFLVFILLLTFRWNGNAEMGLTNMRGASRLFFFFNFFYPGTSFCFWGL